MKFQESSVLRNFIYLFFNQFFSLIIPLLVFPFLLKTLGLELFGLYSLTYAGIIFCFMFCDYGFNFSGSKYIAINKLDSKKRDIAFSTIISLKILISILISIFWISYVFLNARFENNTLFGILFTGMILGNSLNLQWFFQGIEQLGWYSATNSIIKLTSNILILFILKSPKDIYLIPLIYSSAFLLTGIINVFLAIFFVKVKFNFLNFTSFKMFLKEGFDYFITISTTSLVFNGTIIILSFFEKSILIIGAFSALDRIIKILVSVYVPYSTAIYPRNIANFQINEKKGKQSVIKYGSIALFCTLICLVLIFFFSEKVLFLLNPNLVSYANWLKVYSFWLVFIIINNLIGYHYMNGLNKSNIFRNINIIYTFTTISLMIFGCYFFSFKGCIIAVILGEMFLTTFLIFKMRSNNFQTE
jgi:polysaccharide transporter, PST family